MLDRGHQANPTSSNFIGFHQLRQGANSARPITEHLSTSRCCSSGVQWPLPPFESSQQSQEKGKILEKLWMFLFCFTLHLWIVLNNLYVKVHQISHFSDSVVQPASRPTMTLFAQRNSSLHIKVGPRLYTCQAQAVHLYTCTGVHIVYTCTPALFPDILGVLFHIAAFTAPP